jgi:hypothetical protein
MTTVTSKRFERQTKSDKRYIEIKKEPKLLVRLSETDRE